MHFEIDHTLQYTYSQPVFLAPVTLRLLARTDCTQTLLHHEMTLNPRPAGLVRNLEFDGIVSAYAWFNDLHDSFTVRVKNRVETLRANPFDFILAEPEYGELPMRYPAALKAPLAPYCRPADAEPEAAELARAIMAQVNGRTMDFPGTLARYISQNFERVQRDDGEPYRPAELLRKRRGACRDLAVLYNEACRAVGLGARFVSGYCNQGEANAEHDLHAWSEIYLPGGGWRGYDPSTGGAVADFHIALATAAEPAGAAPVVGLFYGSGARSSLRYEVQITPVAA